MTILRIAGSKKHSSVNGPGIRYVVFMQGCPHHCPGCQNPETWNPGGGFVTNVEAVIEDIRSTRYLDGVTLSGGDPLWQPEASRKIAKAAKDDGLNVWLYTGWTYEQILQRNAGAEALSVLSYVDVLVDGRFEEALKTGRALWRGSDNQRLIDVQASLVQKQAVLWQSEIGLSSKKQTAT